MLQSVRDGWEGLDDTLGVCNTAILVLRDVKVHATQIEEIEIKVSMLMRNKRSRQSDQEREVAEKTHLHTIFALFLSGYGHVPHKHALSVDINISDAKFSSNLVLRHLGVTKTTDKTGAFLLGTFPL